MTSLIETLNLFGQRFADFALPMLIQTSLLIAFLLALDLVLRKRVRAVFRYGLWMLVLIKLVLPPSFSSPTGLGYWLPAKAVKRPEKPIIASVPVQVTVRYSEAEPVYFPATAPLPPYVPSLNWRAVLLLGWTTVALGFVIWLVLRARFVARMSARARDVPDSLVELLELCRRQLRIKRRVRLKFSTEATSPAVCGLWQPTILIPAQLANKLSALPMRAVLLHELAHIKRGDLWVNYAQTLLQIFYWYNPMLWLANAIIRRVREQAVDEMVMVEMGQEADAYPATLLEVAKLTFTRSVLSLGLVGIMESKGALKQRIQALLSRPMPTAAKLGWKGLVCVSLVGLIALPMASHPKANAAEVKDKSAGPVFVVEAAVVTANKKTAGQFARSPNGPMTGILNPEQIQLAMDTFRRTKGVKIVDSIIDNVMNGRKGHFTIFVTGENSKLQSGVECEIQPVLKDGMIDLHVKARIGESLNPAATSEALGSIDVFAKKFEFESSVSLPVGSSTVLHRQEEAGGFDNNYWIVLTARFASETEATKTLNTPQYGPLFTRFFKVDTNLFVQALQGRGNQSTNTNLYENIRDFLTQAGVYIEPPKNFYYNGGHGLLMIRGTTNDLATVEKAIKDLDAAPAPSVEATATNLYTGMFWFDTNTFLAKLREQTRLSETSSPKEQQEAVLKLFSAAGVQLKPPAGMVHDEVKGIIVIRANTLKELELVEQVLTKLTASPFAFSPPRNQRLQEFIDSSTNTSTNRDKVPVLGDLAKANPQKAEAATLVQDGRVLYELGKLDEAEAKLNQARIEDPGNPGVDHYLRLIREARYAEITRKRKQPVMPNPYARTNLIQISEGRQTILSKLDRIRFDEVHFDGLPLSEVIKTLNIETRKRDPDKMGVNFIINSHAETSPSIGAFQDAALAIDPTTGLPVNATANNSEPVDLNAVAITINPAITDVRLVDVLDAILKVADKPIKYSVEDYAVVFSLKGNEVPPLFTRFYKVDPNSFFASLQKQVGLTATASADERQQAIRKFFSNVGADFQLPKSILFNDQTGALMARATLQDLDIVESAVQTLNIAPPQVTIEAKFIEVPEQVAKGLSWPTHPNNKETNAWISTLTESQMKTLLKQLESKSGVDILTAPRVTTLSGRPARIEVMDTHTVLKGINPQALTTPGITTFTDGNSNSLYFTETMLFGPAIDVIPTVMADGYTISMTAIPSVTEFLGYDENQTSRVPVYIKGKREWVTPPLPKFRTRQIVGSASVSDSQTLMVGNPLDASHQIVEKPGDGKKRLIVLVTPTIIDPSGNRVHTEGEISSEKRK